MSMPMSNEIQCKLASVSRDEQEAAAAEWIALQAAMPVVLGSVPCQ